MHGRISKMTTPRPPEKVWQKAVLYFCDLYDHRWPVCGWRLVWVIVGRKWVKCCTPIQHQKWRMKRADWDKTYKEIFVKKEIDNEICSTSNDTG